MIAELWADLRYRLRALFRRHDLERELDQELAFHLTQATAKYLALGLTPAEAKRRAQLEFGSMDNAKEESREGRGTALLEATLSDLRYAIRGLLAHPAFSAGVVLTLALGIGANTAVFSLIESVLLKPLPYPQPNQIVSLALTDPRGQVPGTGAVVPDRDFAVWQRDSRSFTALAALSDGSAVLTEANAAEEINGAEVSGDFFAVLRVAPHLGRTLSAADTKPGAPPVVAISQALWNRRFGGDSGVLSRSATLDGVKREIVGVMPSSFQYPSAADYWIPRDFAPRTDGHIVMFLTAVGRLAPGRTLGEATTELQTIQARAESTLPPRARGGRVEMRTLHERLYGSARGPLLTLLGAVAFVLLIACTTTANLFMARAAARRREFAIRASLGAGRGRLIRQLLVESVLLAALGALVGLAFPAWGTRVLSAVIPASVGHVPAATLDGWVLLFAAAVALLTGVTFGLTPLAGWSWSNLSGVMKASAPGAGGGNQGRARQGLIVVQLAAAVVLLAGAGLLIRSVAAFVALDPGFDPRHVLAVLVDLPRARYANDRARSTFYHQLLQEMHALPGVVAAAEADAVPLFGFSMITRFGVDGAVPVGEHVEEAAVNRVTPGYLAALGLTLKAGRWFTPADEAGAPRVAVINEAMAQARFRGMSPIGHRLYIRPPPDAVPGTLPVQPLIVGVVGDARQIGDQVQAMPEAFFAAAQDSAAPQALTLRTSGPPLELLASVKRTIAAIDPSVAVWVGADLSDVYARTYADRRVDALLVSAFALVALVLSALGLYAVMSYLVIQRTREIGMRMALGASARQVLQLVIRQGMTATFLGLGLGLIGAFLLTRELRALLFRVSATDPSVFAIVSLILAGVALGACYLPARRATRVDPMTALRWD